MPCRGHCRPPIRDEPAAEPQGMLTRSSRKISALGHLLSFEEGCPPLAYRSHRRTTALIRNWLRHNRALIRHDWNSRDDALSTRARLYYPFRRYERPWG